MVRGELKGFDLPPGWTIKVTTRKSGASAGGTDRYFYEPVTNKRFRSIPEVRRYLQKEAQKDGETGRYYSYLNCWTAAGRPDARRKRPDRRRVRRERRRVRRRP